VQFRVVGIDAVQVRQWADQAKEILRANPSMRGVNDNWNESIKVLRLNIDQDKARALGVTSQAIAQASRTILSGSTVGQYREGDKLVDIVLRQPADERNAITDAKVSFSWEPGVLWREGRNFAVTIQGDVVEGVQGPTVTAQVWPKLKELAKTMPPGYGIEVAGAVEESSKGQGSLLANVPLMAFIMLTLLMLQLQSFSRAMLVMLTAPLGIAGVAGALLVLNRPFGFVALLGFIALVGMIMRNSVILIDQIEQDRQRGVPAWDAIVESAVRRFRPIVLTAAAAVLAMIPLSRSVFWGPMAVAIMGGLIVATALTLLALPAMYAAWFRVRREPQAG
jgi:multidrug efflux pump